MTNWILVLGILGIAIGVWYFTRGQGASVAATSSGKVMADNPGAALPAIGSRAPGAKSGFAPPPPFAAKASLVTPSSGPVSTTRSGRGAF